MEHSLHAMIKVVIVRFHDKTFALQSMLVIGMLASKKAVGPASYTMLVSVVGFHVSQKPFVINDF